MAAMNIDEMQPGLELDQLVAEKVMGWTATVAAFGADKGTLYRTDCTPYEDVPGFSVGIAAAWVVFDRMAELGFRSTVGDNGNKHAASNDCRFWNEKDDRRAISISETAPLAICRAAIKAVME